MAQLECCFLRVIFPGLSYYYPILPFFSIVLIFMWKILVSVFIDLFLVYLLLLKMQTTWKHEPHFSFPLLFPRSMTVSLLNKWVNKRMYRKDWDLCSQDLLIIRALYLWSVSRDLLVEVARILDISPDSGAPILLQILVYSPFPLFIHLAHVPGWL